MIREGVRPVVAQVTAVGIGISFGLASGGIGSAEDLKGFEKSWEGNLEGWWRGFVICFCVVRVFGGVGNGGEVGGVGRKETLAPVSDPWRTRSASRHGRGLFVNNTHLA